MEIWQKGGEKKRSRTHPEPRTSTVLILKIVAAIFLIIILGALGWIATHLRRINREIVADEALPKPGPRTNFLILLCVVLTGLLGLLISFLFFH